MRDVQLLRRLEVLRRNGDHLDRGRIAGLGRYEDHGGHPAIDGKRHFLDLLFVRHDPIVPGRQDSIDTRQLEWMMKTTDLLVWRVAIALARRAPAQRIVQALVQAANSLAVISVFIDFEMGPEKKFRRKLFYREANGVRRVRKTFVPGQLSFQCPIADGEQLRFGAVIECDHAIFDHGRVSHLNISK